MDVQRGVWGERWGLQEVPKGFSVDTVQQQYNGDPKIRERDAHMRMKTKFVDKDEDSDYCFHLVLSESHTRLPRFF
jgi:hypothetical protein